SHRALSEHKTLSISWSHYPALDNFTQAIQSQILGGLLSNINTGKPGRMVTNDYIVDIANRDGQLQLNVTDRKTGQTSTIQVSGLQNNSTDF
ncbi:curli assembly protein CsgF, partial [Escherichia coli]|uniref:curli assembly protein CsgF n=1 Tax=Escherichia coli TaxID=562 RepID=UPI002FD9DB81